MIAQPRVVEKGHRPLQLHVRVLDPEIKGIFVPRTVQTLLGCFSGGFLGRYRMVKAEQDYLANRITADRPEGKLSEITCEWQ